MLACRLAGPVSGSADAGRISVFFARPVWCTEIVLNHRVRTDRHSAWICQIELAKDNLVAPDLTKEISEDVNCQLLPGTPPVAEAEWSEPRIVTDWLACPVDDAEHRAEAAIGDVRLASVFHLEIGNIERTAREPYLSDICLR